LSEELRAAMRRDGVNPDALNNTGGEQVPTLDPGLFETAFDDVPVDQEYESYLGSEASSFDWG
jgi:hypothetical protein